MARFQRFQQSIGIVCGGQNASRSWRNYSSVGDGVRAVVDMRSDTITKPTQEMRKKMSEAVVGDDVLGEDPTTIDFEQYAATKFGKEAALFVPTGTMGNLLSIMAHCTGRGEEMYIGNQSHLFTAEQGGSAQFAGVHCRTLTNLEDGTFSLEELSSAVHSGDDFHETVSRLVCLENTHNTCGGRPLPLEFLKQVQSFCSEAGLSLHMDGARVVNAAVAQKCSAADILKYCDTASICLSKGLGAPVGSVIVGPHHFISSCRRLRKALGGGMRQTGVLTAACQVALEQAETMVERDHTHAKILAQGRCLLDRVLNGISVHFFLSKVMRNLSASSERPNTCTCVVTMLLGIFDIGSELVSVQPDTVDTNIVLVTLTSPTLTPEVFIRRLMEEDGSGTVPVCVRPARARKGKVRFVTHRDLTEDDIVTALRRVRHVLTSINS